MGWTLFSHGDLEMWREVGREERETRTGGVGRRRRSLLASDLHRNVAGTAQLSCSQPRRCTPACCVLSRMAVSQ